MNATAVEAAVMSGFAAAFAIRGEPVDVPGFDFLMRRPWRAHWGIAPHAQPPAGALPAGALKESVRLPNFISWTGHGAATSAPPAIFTDAHAYVLTIEADREAMRRLADKLLNPAAPDGVRYEPVSSAAIFSFVDVASCAPREEEIGWTPGRECAVWIPLWEHRRGRLTPRLVLWAPYVFIDYTLGLITGREVWGWPKVGGVIAIDRAAPDAPKNLTCETMIFRDFGRHVQASHETLIAVRAVGPSAASPSRWAEMTHGLTAIAEHWTGEVVEIARRAHLGKLSLPAIALKQFRDSHDPTLACYQAIVNSPCQLARYRGGGHLAGAFELEIAQCRSHPILNDLTGREVRTEGAECIPVKHAAWINFDFTAEPGSVVTR